MLSFFRKHQRIFFVVTSVVIIISFSFFGTFSAFLSTEKVSDRVIGKAVDGSPISEREVDAIVRFLATAYEDRGMSQKRMLNVLNDSVICKDLLASGMGAMIAERYFQEIKPEFEERLKKTKHYRPYRHPQAPFLAAEVVWEQFNPNMNKHLTALKEKIGQATPETFSLLCDLYIDQSHLHPDILKRILMYQQDQYSWLQRDPTLPYENLGLFGFESLEDWVGKPFLEIAAQFLINCSIIAEQKGYHVSLEEARSELFQNARIGLQRVAGNNEFSSSDVVEYVRNEFRSLGIDETTAVKIWKKVMLFRRMFQDVGNAVLLDHLAHRQFQSYADDTVSLDIYELPLHLKFRDLRSMLKFQAYLEAISAAPKNQIAALDLPKQVLKPEELEKRCPSLVKRRFLLEFSEIDKDQIALKISLRETWDWQLKDEHWEKLIKEFPILAKNDARTREERFQILDKLDDKTRLVVDQFSRANIIESHPEWIAEAFESRPAQTKAIGLRSKGGVLPFEGLEDSSELAQLLQAAPIKDEIDSSRAAIEAQNRLAQFTANGKKYYKIAVVKRAPQKEIVSFEEADADGTLDDILDAKLQEAYSDTRKKDPGTFQESDGSWKPFEHVKDQVALKVYAELLRAIEDDARKDGESIDDVPVSDFYASHRLASYVREAKNKIEKNIDEPRFIKIAEEANSQEHLFDEELSIQAQCRLIKTHKEVRRAEEISFGTQKIFESPIGSWSSIAVNPSGEIVFFHVLDRFHPDNSDEERITEAQHLLSMDAQRLLMHQMLDQIQEKHAIVLTEGQKE
ncbi:MAG TPA: hypothetical protein VLG49_05200 [Rhabdochlamydiaceae bacterium]|nr:hypothetical protein [Rhabdochlamydiaceae bacterium]